MSTGGRGRVTTIGAALAEAARRLEAAGVSNARREAGWMLAHLMGCSAGALRLRAQEDLPPDVAEGFRALVERRTRREPLQYILGTEEFLGLTFRVTPAVLIPRPETEVLVEEAVRRLRGRGPVRVADIGTGSGAIAVALAHRLPGATVVATDISPEALAVAGENAAANGVSVEFRQGDLLAPLAGEQFDAILSNPPYIGEAELEGLMPEVRDWEPRVALTPGEDGLEVHRRLAFGAPALLRPGGFLAVEVGIGQAGQVADLFARAGLVGITRHLDPGGIERVVIGSVAG